MMAASVPAAIDIVLLVQAVASAAMCGIIWFV